MVTFFPGLFAGTEFGAIVYYDTSTAIIGLVLLGRLLEARAKGQTSDAVRALMVKAVATTEVKKMLADGGLIPIGSSPEEFSDFLKKDVVKQADIIKKIGLEPQ